MIVWWRVVFNFRDIVVRITVVVLDWWHVVINLGDIVVRTTVVALAVVIVEVLCWLADLLIVVVVLFLIVPEDVHFSVVVPIVVSIGVIVLPLVLNIRVVR